VDGGSGRAGAGGQEVVVSRRAVAQADAAIAAAGAKLAEAVGASGRTPSAAARKGGAAPGRPAAASPPAAGETDSDGDLDIEMGGTSSGEDARERAAASGPHAQHPHPAAAAVAALPRLRDPLSALLLRTLREIFGHADFRGEQRAVDAETLELIPHSEMMGAGAGGAGAGGAGARGVGAGAGAPRGGARLVRMSLQEWAVRRVIAGQRTLLVAATGSGKSLT
jgi:hypothetical protein